MKTLANIELVTVPVVRHGSDLSPELVLYTRQVYKNSDGSQETTEWLPVKQVAELPE